jgi:hypothetical protein
MKAGVFPHQHQLPQRGGEPAADGKRASDWQTQVARWGQRPQQPEDHTSTGDKSIHD